MIGDRLKELRIKKKLKQKDIAEALDLSAVIIGLYEKDERNPDLDNLKKLANFFEVSTDYLLSMEPRDNDKNELQIDTNSIADEISKKRKLANLSQNGLAHILNISRQHIIDAESGKKVNPDILGKICRYLKVNYTSMPLDLPLTAFALQEESKPYIEFAKILYENKVDLNRLKTIVDAAFLIKND